MGAPPELPDPSENDIRPIEAAAPIVSDESDNDFNADYDGYEPLALDDFNDEQENILVEEVEITTETDPNLPVIERAEIELEREVWNAPRPQETNIELDSQRTAQILNAMANVTLPSTFVLPEWAVGVPEERWKEDLLQRIRQRQEEQQNSDEQKT